MFTVPVFMLTHKTTQVIKQYLHASKEPTGANTMKEDMG